MLLFSTVRVLASALITLAVLGFGGYKVYDAVGGATTGAGDRDSMFRAAGLGDALAELRERGDGDALRVAVYPAYVSAELSTGSETEGQGLKVEQDGDVEPFDLRLTGPGKLADNVFALSQVDAGVFEGIVAGARRDDPSLGIEDLTHAIAAIDPISGEAGWKVYFGAAGAYTADLDGTNLKRTGDAPATSSQADRAVADATRITDCLARAAGDVERVQACTK